MHASTTPFGIFAGCVEWIAILSPDWLCTTLDREGATTLYIRHFPKKREVNTKRDERVLLTYVARAINK